MSSFQDDYGLKAIDGADDDNEDEDGDDAGEDGDDSDDIGGSEGYEIIEGNDDDIEG